MTGPGSLVRFAVMLSLPALLLAACIPAAAQDLRVLVFSKTAGFRHDSIPAGIALIQNLGAAHGFGVDVSEDADVFTPQNLGAYRAVVFLNTTGDVLNAGQQAAFEAYVRGGGGWVGVHAAADTEYAWPFYGELLGGAWFSDHPAIQAATLHVEDGAHPSTRHLPASFSFTDEWYNFRANPRGAVDVLLTLDEASYSPGPGAMGDHPIAWSRALGAGRAWYTNLGHRSETYGDPLFAQHLLGGIRWAAAGSTPPPPPPDPPSPLPGVAPITSQQIPNFRFWVRIGGTRIGTKAADCVPQTVCVASAIPTRAEVLLRIVRKPNGFLWPHIVKFTTSATEVWIQQITTGQTKRYVLPAAAPDSDDLSGLIDRTGFRP
jgi:type 1 glutamine amidotransferase